MVEDLYSKNNIGKNVMTTTMFRKRDEDASADISTDFTPPLLVKRKITETREEISEKISGKTSVRNTYF